MELYNYYPCHYLITNLGRIKYTFIDGKEYIVAPMTTIVPGVLNGSKGALYYPPDEIKRNVREWDNIPITVYHPDVAGRHASASEPGVMERQGIGFLAKSEYKGKLVHEGYFDIERTKIVDNRILEALETGQAIELSTGLFTENEPAIPGANYNGKGYDYIARNYKPDHLAVLPDQIGACSIRDGCGVLVNRFFVDHLESHRMNDPSYVSSNDVQDNETTDNTDDSYTSSIHGNGTVDIDLATDLREGSSKGSINNSTVPYINGNNSTHSILHRMFEWLVSNSGISRVDIAANANPEGINQYTKDGSEASANEAAVDKEVAEHNSIHGYKIASRERPDHPDFHDPHRLTVEGHVERLLGRGGKYPVAKSFFSSNSGVRTTEFHIKGQSHSSVRLASNGSVHVEGGVTRDREAVVHPTESPASVETRLKKTLRIKDTVPPSNNSNPEGINQYSKGGATSEAAKASSKLSGSAKGKEALGLAQRAMASSGSGNSEKAAARHTEAAAAHREAAKAGGKDSTSHLQVAELHEKAAELHKADKPGSRTTPSPNPRTAVPATKPVSTPSPSPKSTSAPATVAPPATVTPKGTLTSAHVVQAIKDVHKGGLADMADVREHELLKGHSKEHQDEAIAKARSEGKVSGSSYEGRHGVSERQKAAVHVDKWGEKIGGLAVRNEESNTENISMESQTSYLRTQSHNAMGRGNWSLSKRSEHANSLTKKADQASSNIDDDSTEEDHQTAFQVHKEAADAHRMAAREAATGSSRGGEKDFAASGYHANKAAYHADKADQHGKECGMVAEPEDRMTKVENEGGSSTISTPSAPTSTSTPTIPTPASRKKEKKLKPSKASAYGSGEAKTKIEGSTERAKPVVPAPPTSQKLTPPSSTEPLPSSNANPISRDSEGQFSAKGKGKGATKSDSKGSNSGSKDSGFSDPEDDDQSPGDEEKVAQLRSMGAYNQDSNTPPIENQAMRISYEDILTNQELGDSSRFASNDERLFAFKEMLHIYNEFSKGEPRRALLDLIGNFNPHHDQQGRFTDEASSTTGKVVQSHTGRGGVQSHTGREGAQSHTGREGTQSHTGRAGSSSKEKEDHERAQDEFADAFGKQLDKEHAEKHGDEISHAIKEQGSKEKEELSGKAAGASKLARKQGKRDTGKYGRAHARAASAHAQAASAHAASGDAAMAAKHNKAGEEHAAIAKKHGQGHHNPFTYNQDNPFVGEFDMTREADITWLATNCDCWKGPGDLETLNMLSDEKLATLKDVARHSLAEKYALRRGLKVGKKHYTWNAATGRFDTKKVVKAGVEQAGGEEQEDEYNVNADDEEYDSDEEDDMDEDDNDEVAKRFRGMKDTRNKGSGKGRTTMNMQQWESTMPPEARRVWNLAKSVEANTRNTLIQQLIANVYGDKERQLLYNTLKDKSMQELQVLANLVPPSVGYGTPDFIPQSYVGASVPAHNRATTNDSESDVLPLPTINFSEWAKGNSGS